MFAAWVELYARLTRLSTEMMQIPLEPVPSQRLSVVIAGQNCLLNVYAKTDSMYVDLTVNDVPVLRTQAARNGIGLLFAARYFGFVGELVFIDQQGDEQPSFEGLNDRWLLLYLDPSELVSA